MKPDRRDIECLRAARDDQQGFWLPWRGAFARAGRLASVGLLKQAGIAVMPPHKVYVLTEAGIRTLASAEGRAN